jgi:ERCC4-related helicase
VLLLLLLLLQMSDIGLLIFDEAHHCKSDHPYNQIMQVRGARLAQDKMVTKHSVHCLRISHAL